MFRYLTVDAAPGNRGLRCHPLHRRFPHFDIVWTLTGGGPARSTELVSQYAYVSAFLNLDFGRGSAAAIIAGLIILVLGIVLYRFLRSRCSGVDERVSERALFSGMAPARSERFSRW